MVQECCKEHWLKLAQLIKADKFDQAFGYAMDSSMCAACLLRFGAITLKEADWPEYARPK